MADSALPSVGSVSHILKGVLNDLLMEQPTLSAGSTSGRLPHVEEEMKQIDDKRKSEVHQLRDTAHRLSELSTSRRAADAAEFGRLRDHNLLSGHEVPLAAPLGEDLTADSHDNPLVSPAGLLAAVERERLIRSGNMVIGLTAPSFSKTAGAPHYLASTALTELHQAGNQERFSGTLGGFGAEFRRSVAAATPNTARSSNSRSPSRPVSPIVAVAAALESQRQLARATSVGAGTSNGRVDTASGSRRPPRRSVSFREAAPTTGSGGELPTQDEWLSNQFTQAEGGDYDDTAPPAGDVSPPFVAPITTKSTMAATTARVTHTSSGGRALTGVPEAATLSLTGTRGEGLVSSLARSRALESARRYAGSGAGPGMSIEQIEEEARIAARMTSVQNYVRNPRFSKAGADTLLTSTTRRASPTRGTNTGSGSTSVGAGAGTSAHTSPRAVNRKMSTHAGALSPARKQHETSLLPTAYLQQHGVPFEATLVMQSAVTGATEASAGLFTVRPAALSWSQYEAGSQLTLGLTVRNIDSLSRHLRVLPPKTKYFVLESVAFPTEQHTGGGGEDTGARATTAAANLLATRGTPSSLVAPGMSVRIQIRFCPRSTVPYTDELALTTEQGSFTIPLLATLPAPELDLPLQLEAGVCLPLDTVTTTLRVRNSGAKAQFKVLAVDSREGVLAPAAGSGDSLRVGPFTVQPAAVEVAMNEAFDFALTFTPTSEGQYTAQVAVLCSNGDITYHTITGEAPRLQVGIVELDSAAVVRPVLECTLQTGGTPSFPVPTITSPVAVVSEAVEDGKGAPLPPARQQLHDFSGAVLSLVSGTAHEPSNAPLVPFSSPPPCTPALLRFPDCYPRATVSRTIRVRNFTSLAIKFDWQVLGWPDAAPDAPPLPSWASDVDGLSSVAATRQGGGGGGVGSVPMLAGFTVFPSTGTLQPQAEGEFTVTFCPHSTGAYEAVAYMRLHDIPALHSAASLNNNATVSGSVPGSARGTATREAVSGTARKHSIRQHNDEGVSGDESGSPTQGVEARVTVRSFAQCCIFGLSGIGCRANVTVEPGLEVAFPALALPGVEIHRAITLVNHGSADISFRFPPQARMLSRNGVHIPPSVMDDESSGHPVVIASPRIGIIPAHASVAVALTFSCLRPGTYRCVFGDGAAATGIQLYHGDDYALAADSCMPDDVMTSQPGNGSLSLPPSPRGYTAGASAFVPSTAATGSRSGSGFPSQLSPTALRSVPMSGRTDPSQLFTLSPTTTAATSSPRGGAEAFSLSASTPQRARTQHTQARARNSTPTASPVTQLLSGGSPSGWQENAAVAFDFCKAGSVSLVVAAGVTYPTVRFLEPRLDLGLLGTAVTSVTVCTLVNDSACPAPWVLGRVRTPHDPPPIPHTQQQLQQQLRRGGGVALPPASVRVLLSAGGESLVAGGPGTGTGDEEEEGEEDSTFIEDEGFIVDAALKEAGVQIDPPCGVLEPFSSMQVRVTCHTGLSPQRLRAVLRCLVGATLVSDVTSTRAGTGTGSGSARGRGDSSRFDGPSTSIIVLTQSPPPPRLYLPLEAEIQSPKVIVSTSSISYGVVFLGVPVRRTITLKNLSNLPAPYTFEPYVGTKAPKAADSSGNATVTSPTGGGKLRTSRFALEIWPGLTGTLNPKETREFELLVTPCKLGPVRGALVACDINGMPYPLGFRISMEVLGITVAYAVLDDATGETLPDAPASTEAFAEDGEAQNEGAMIGDETPAADGSTSPVSPQPGDQQLAQRQGQRLSEDARYELALRSIDPELLSNASVVDMQEAFTRARHAGAKVFSLPPLHFGDVVVGTRRTLTLRVFNLSGIPTDAYMCAQRFVAWEDAEDTGPAGKPFPRLYAAADTIVNRGAAAFAKGGSLLQQASALVGGDAAPAAGSARAVVAARRNSKYGGLFTVAGSVLPDGVGAQTPPGSQPGMLLSAKHESTQRFASEQGAEYMARQEVQQLMKTSLGLGHGVAFEVYPRQLTLPPFGSALVQVAVVCDMSGLYSDEFVVRMDGRPDIRVPLTVNVTGHSLLLQPGTSGLQMRGALGSKAPTLNFGDHTAGGLQVSKTLMIENASPLDAHLVWHLMHDRCPSFLPPPASVDFEVREGGGGGVSGAAPVALTLRPHSDRNPADPPPFSISPPTLLIPAHSKATVKLNANPLPVPPTAMTTSRVAYGWPTDLLDVWRGKFGCDVVWSPPGGVPDALALSRIQRPLSPPPPPSPRLHSRGELGIGEGSFEAAFGVQETADEVAFGVRETADDEVAGAIAADAPVAAVSRPEYHRDALVIRTVIKPFVPALTVHKQVLSDGLPYVKFKVWSSQMAVGPMERTTPAVGTGTGTVSGTSGGGKGATVRRPPLSSALPSPGLSFPTAGGGAGGNGQHIRDVVLTNDMATDLTFLLAVEGPFTILKCETNAPKHPITRLDVLPPPQHSDSLSDSNAALGATSSLASLFAPGSVSNEAAAQAAAEKRIFNLSPRATLTITVAYDAAAGSSLMESAAALFFSPTLTVPRGALSTTLASPSVGSGTSAGAASLSASGVVGGAITSSITRLKGEHVGALVATFVNGHPQRIGLIADVLRPALAPSSSHIPFPVVRVGFEAPKEILLSNPTEVPAHWTLKHIPTATTRTAPSQIDWKSYGLASESKLWNPKDTSVQPLDDPTVFGFDVSGGVVAGPTVPPSLADGANLRHSAGVAAPARVGITFKPKQNVMYQSRFRFTVKSGESCEIVLLGKGTYEEWEYT